MTLTELKPCPFCGEIRDLQLLNLGDLVDFDCHYTCEKQLTKIAPLAHSWFVNCPHCGTCGPDVFIDTNDFTPEQLRVYTDEECKEKAMQLWNERYGDHEKNV